MARRYARLAAGSDLGGAVLLDTGLGFGMRDAAANAKRAEDLGYAAAWSAETSHDPFLPLAVAAEATTRIGLGTGIAVAFPRSPMVTAMLAWDLAAHTGGRFLLGLGSQIQPHIEKRFSASWDRPVGRMRDYINALRAIWDCWQNGSKLAYRGPFYRHTLMTPFFNPGPLPDPGGPDGVPVYLAGVGPAMTELGGELCDGFLLHAFTTPTWIRDVTVPAIELGLARAGRDRTQIQLSCPVFVVSGDTEATVRASATAVRAQIAFYGSTPAYAGVLEREGYADLPRELNTLSKRGEWSQMGALIDDDLLDRFAVVCDPDDLHSRVVERYGGLVDRVTFAVPGGDPPRQRELVRQFNG